MKIISRRRLDLLIKRPLLWGIVAFIGGILAAWYEVPLIHIFMVGLLSYLLIYFLIYHIKLYFNPKDNILWALPILMLIGFFAMRDRVKPLDMDAAFEEKAECQLTGEIKMIVKKSWGTSYYLKDNKVSLPDGNDYLVEEIIVNTYTDKEIQQSQEYRIGNLINVSGTIQKFSINSNPGGFNEYLYYKSQNISYKVNAKELTLVDGSYSRFHLVLNNIKDKLLQVFNTILSEKEVGTIIAMVLGEKYLLGDEIKSLYQENGVSHILAISGLHISMVGAAIYFMLRKLRLGLMVSTVMSLVIVFSYGIFTNFSVSTNRAVVMYCIMLLARLIGKTYDIISALSLSAFLILIQNPMELFQAGFLLSFGAVLGIAIILPCMNILHEAKSSLLKSIYVSISAQVFTLPFVLYYFFQIPTYSVIINLIILPLMSLLILSSLVAGIGGLISISFGVFLVGGANYILKFYEWVCRIGSSLPWNLVTVGRPDNIRILIYFVILLVFIMGVRRLEKKRFLVFFALAVLVLIFPMPREGLTITMLDVGQGEAIFMETGSGATYFIDGGSSDVNQVGRYRIAPYLLSKGRDRLDYAIITHTDMDHVSGLIELIEGKQITIKRLILPDTTSRNEIYQKLEVLAAAKGIELMYIVSGDMIIDGGIQMTFLHPPKGYQPASNNDYSAVLSISYGDFDMLLTGDIEDKGEKELIKYLPVVQTDYDVLKVAHHGSKNSTSQEFLSVIKPELALISCGRSNRYGHPHEELLERLKRSGAEVMITKESGAITIKTDGKRMVVTRVVTRGRGDLSP